MAYIFFKNLAKRTVSDKLLRDKTTNIAKNPKYDGCKCRIALMVDEFFDRKSFGSAIKSINSTI